MQCLGRAEHHRLELTSSWIIIKKTKEIGRITQKILLHLWHPAPPAHSPLSLMAWRTFANSDSCMPSQQEKKQVKYFLLYAASSQAHIGVGTVLKAPRFSFPTTEPHKTPAMLLTVAWDCCPSCGSQSPSQHTRCWLASSQQRVTRGKRNCWLIWFPERTTGKLQSFIPDIGSKEAVK